MSNWCKKATGGHEGVSDDATIKHSDQQIDKISQNSYYAIEQAQSLGKNHSEKVNASAVSKTGRGGELVPNAIQSSSQKIFHPLINQTIASNISCFSAPLSLDSETIESSGRWDAIKEYENSSTTITQSIEKYPWK